MTDWWEDLQRFNETGTIEEFLDWYDTEAGQAWNDPMCENWLIRRDTLRKVGFNVMRRAVGREIHD